MFLNSLLEVKLHQTGLMARRKAHNEEVHLKYVMKEFFQMAYDFDRWQKKNKKYKDKNVLCSLQEQLTAWLEFLDVLFSSCSSDHRHAYPQIQ